MTADGTEPLTLALALVTLMRSFGHRSRRWQAGYDVSLGRSLIGQGRSAADRRAGRAHHSPALARRTNLDCAGTTTTTPEAELCSAKVVPAEAAVVESCVRQ